MLSLHMPRGSEKIYGTPQKVYDSLRDDDENSISGIWDIRGRVIRLKSVLLAT